MPCFPMALVLVFVVEVMVEWCWEPCGRKLGSLRKLGRGCCDFSLLANINQLEADDLPKSHDAIDDC